MTMIKPSIDQISALGFSRDIHGVFAYGSSVYGCTSAKDIDLIVIAGDVEDGSDLREGLLDIHLHSMSAFEQRVASHDVVALECLFNPDNTDIDIPFSLDLALLRKSFSSKASNSWVKGKKKIDVERDFYIGRKSLWHSLRILMFGIALAKTGKIDFSAANHLYAEIVGSDDTAWTPYKDKYQPLYNALSSEFRMVAPL